MATTLAWRHNDDRVRRMRVDRRADDRRTAAGTFIAVVHVMAMVPFAAAPVAVRVTAVVVSDVGGLGTGRWFLAITVVASVLIAIEQRLLLLRGRLGLTSQHDGANGDSRVEELCRQMPGAALNGHDPLLEFIGTSPADFAGGIILWCIQIECGTCS